MQITIRTYRTKIKKKGQPTLVRSLTCSTIEEALAEMREPVARKVYDGSGRHFGNVLINGHFLVYCDGNRGAYNVFRGQKPGRKYDEMIEGEGVPWEKGEGETIAQIIEALNAVAVM